MGSLLTNILALAPRLGAPMGAEATTEILFDSPTVHQYLLSMGVDYHSLYVEGPTLDRQRLLALGNTGFMGAMPPLRRKKTLDQIFNLKILQTLFKQYWHDGKINQVFSVLDRIGELGGETKLRFLREVADNVLKKTALKMEIDASRFANAYAMSQIGLCALQNLAKQKSFYALAVVEDILRGKKGIVAFPFGFNKAMLLNPEEPYVAAKIFKVLSQREYGTLGVLLIKDLLERMHYNIGSSTSVMDVWFSDEGEKIRFNLFPAAVSAGKDAFSAVVQCKKGELFLRLLEKNPMTIETALSCEGISRLEFKPDDEGGLLQELQEKIKKQPDAAELYIRMDHPEVSEAVLTGLEKALHGPDYRMSIRVLLKNVGGDAAARILVAGYKAVTHDALKQLYILDALEKTAGDIAVEFFDDAVRNTPRWRFRERKRMAGRARRTKSK